MQNPIYNEAGKAGLIMGLLSVLVTAIVYALDFTYLANFLFILFNWMLLLGVTIWMYVNWKRERGGYVNFKDAFLFGLLLMVLAGVIDLGFYCLLTLVVDPELPFNLYEASVQSVFRLMEYAGASDSEIDAAIEPLEQTRDQYEAMAKVKGFPGLVVFYSLIALLLAAIFKKERPPFEDA